jgi:hypothetical protein
MARRPPKRPYGPRRYRRVNELREAISAYHAYCHFVDRGRLLVNAGDDPEDVVRPALLYVERCIGECRSLGLTDPEIYQLVASEPRTG